MRPIRKIVHNQHVDKDFEIAVFEEAGCIAAYLQSRPESSENRSTIPKWSEILSIFGVV